MKPGSPGVVQPFPVDCGARPILCEYCTSLNGSKLWSKQEDVACSRSRSWLVRDRTQVQASCRAAHGSTLFVTMLARTLLVAGDEKHPSFQLKPERNSLGTHHCCRQSERWPRARLEPELQCCQPPFPISWFFLVLLFISVGFSR